MPQHLEPTWRVHHVRTTACEQHARDLPPERSVWNIEIVAPAVVLGSRQTEAELDLAACAQAGVDVVRRRSGGGMVYLSPDNQIWLDVVIPRSDPLWIDDVGRASWWLGDVWLAAIESLGFFGAYVHHENLRVGEHGDLFCFAGVGPGEVMVQNAAGKQSKIVGISQRRTQDGARFQCTMYVRWDVEIAQKFGQLLSKSNVQRIDLESTVAHCVAPISALPSDVRAAFFTQLALI